MLEALSGIFGGGPSQEEAIEDTIEKFQVSMTQGFFNSFRAQLDEAYKDEDEG